MNLLPRDVIIEIMLNTDYANLINTCQTDRKVSSICHDYNFWKRKYQYDFGQPPNDKIYSWRQLYEQQLRSKNVYVIEYFDGGNYEILTTAFLNRDHAINQLVESLFKNKHYLQPPNIEEYPEDFQYEPYWIIEHEQ